MKTAVASQSRLTPRSSGRVRDKVPSSYVGVRAAQLNRYASASQVIGGSVSRAGCTVVRVSASVARERAAVAEARRVRSAAAASRHACRASAVRLARRACEAAPVSVCVRARGQGAAFAFVGRAFVVGATHNPPMERTAFGVRSSAR